jgi:hypothetical protein
LYSGAVDKTHGIRSDLDGDPSRPHGYRFARVVAMSTVAPWSTKSTWNYTLGALFDHLPAIVCYPLLFLQSSPIAAAVA